MKKSTVDRVAMVDELMKDGKIAFLQDYTTRNKQFDRQNINEALFCEEFLHERRSIFANGAFFTPDYIGYEHEGRQHW